MPTKPATHGEVKSICDSLETSPSSHSPGSSLYNSGTEPTAAKHSPKHASGAKGKMTNKESNFGSGRKTATKGVPTP
jgi:hypothetical protein